MSSEQHMIAPICADCGREIDKQFGQWDHVLDRPALVSRPAFSPEAQADLDAFAADYERDGGQIL